MVRKYVAVASGINIEEEAMKEREDEILALSFFWASFTLNWLWVICR